MTTSNTQPDQPFDPGQINAGPVGVARPYQLVQARHGVMLVNANDFYMGRAMIEYGECCEIEAQLLHQLLPVRPGKVVEIGANLGIHSVPLAQALAAQSRELVVFEPQPFIFQNLCANLALNGLTNVTAWPWACGAQRETVYFARPDYQAQGNFGGIAVSATAQPDSVAVPCVRLDEVLDEAPVSLLKIDVEGYELAALRGAVNVIQRSRPLLYVENDRVDQSQALIEWLWSHDYQLFWHIPPLYNPHNFFGKTENIYGTVGSFNMVGFPKELGINVNGLREIVSATEHPLAGQM